MNNESTNTAITEKAVAQYLAAVPEEAKATLDLLRETIRSAAPMTEEVISYQVPTFMYFGPLVGYTAFSDHCDFYVMSPIVIDMYMNDLEDYDPGTLIIRFPAGKPLPVELVKKIVEARMHENEALDQRMKG